MPLKHSILICLIHQPIVWQTSKDDEI